MNTIKLIDNQTIGIYLTAYDPKIVGVLKSSPDARYNPSGRFWHYPINDLTIATVKRLQATFDFVLDPLLTDRLAGAAPLKIDSIATVLPLYPYQREIVTFLVNTPHALNASFVGSGKTLTSLAVVDVLKLEKVLIIAPKSVVLQWAESEIPKWLPEAQVLAITGKPPNTLNPPLFTVVGYERAKLSIDLLSQIEWDMIICDEAHRLANPQTKLYKALMKLKTKRRLALTATPIMNKAEDMFGVINWLKPNALGNYYQFINRYSVKDTWGSIKYYKNLPELVSRTKPYIIRRTLDEVDMQLPPYTESILPVELSPPERKLYDQMKMELLFEIESQLISKIENPVGLQMSVVKMGKLFELCDSMELLGEENTSTKLEVLKEHLESTLQNDQKAIIITRFSRMAEILRDRLSGSGWRPLCITGQTKERQSILTKFASDPEAKILVGTEAIAQGLNLQVANILYNYDSAWNPAKMEQRAGRVYRNGQTKPVFIYNLVVKKSVETWLQKKLAGKAELSASLLPKTLTEIKEILEL